MPLEGHWTRQQTSLRGLQPRERRILIVTLVVLVVAVAATAIAGVSSPNKRTSKPGCITLVLGSSMGAGYQYECGAAARRLCTGPQIRASTVYGDSVRAACRDGHIG